MLKRRENPERYVPPKGGMGTCNSSSGEGGGEGECREGLDEGRVLRGGRGCRDLAGLLEDKLGY